MAKRFTSTEKWDKVWFQELPVRLKCLWQYMTDRCDHAGVWEENYRRASFCIGEEVTSDDLSAFKERVQVLDDNKVWLTGFVEFQYGELNPKVNCHKSAIKLLEKHNLSVKQKDSSTLDEPLTKGCPRDMDMDKDKDTKLATRLSKSWKPNESHKSYCAETGLDFEAAVECFKDWAFNSPQKYLDWDRTFHTALKNWIPEKLPKTAGNNYGPSGLRKEVIRP